MNENILYIGDKQKYIDECITSGNITKKAIQDSAELILCAPTSQKNTNHSFDRVLQYTSRNSPLTMMYRIDCIINYIETHRNRKCLYLDGDAAVIDRSAVQLYYLLDRYDIGLTIAPQQQFTRNDKTIPESYPEYNCGVILFNCTSKILKLFKTWRQLYESQCIDLHDHPRGNSHDQTHLRRAIYNSSVNLVTISSVYNNRTNRLGDCKIWHSRQLFKYYE
jgi:hypothetical protein